jgi:hypothetical protein
MRWSLLYAVLAPHMATGKSLVASVGSSLKGLADAPITPIACCGAGRVEGSPTALAEALGASTDSPVVVVSSETTTVALLDVDGVSAADGAAAMTACDVLALEVRFADLVSSSAHGLGQLQPLLQRCVRLRRVRAQPKQLLVTVTGFDGTEASEADVSAFVAAQVDELLAGLAMPEGEEATTAQLLQVQCLFLPCKRRALEAYEEALGSIKAALTDEASNGFLFSGGRLTSSASSFLEIIARAADLAPRNTPAAPPSEVHAAYQCGLLAEAAARDFQKGATALRKAADAGLLSDFGERASSLLTDAIARFDVDSASFKGAAPVAAARAALSEQLQRVLYGPYRKQIATLQRQSVAKFRAKVGAQKPSADIEVQMAKLLSDATDAFNEAAKALVPEGMRWSYTYERQAVVEMIEEAARLQVQTFQVQGLYLSKSGHRMPVDFSAHWLLPHPFGRDSRFDPISSSDEPTFKPHASPMKLRATDGYKPRSSLKDPNIDPAVIDPKGMIFTDKMMQ